jgi:hypothetical protein
MATRADIRGYSRIRADQDNSTFPTDTQYNTLLDFAGKAVWFDLVRAGWPVHFSTATLTATGTNPIALGASGTVAFVRGVFHSDGRELSRLNEGDRGRLMTQTGEPSCYALGVDPTLGAVVELFPVPSSGTFTVHYIAEWAGFASDAAVWPGPARTDELVGLRAAEMGARKEGNDQLADKLVGEYGRLFETVQAMSSWFDLRNPPVIRDVGGGLTLPRDSFDFDVG